MYINADRVNAIFMDCIFHADELPSDRSTPSDAILAEGISSVVYFHSQHLRTYRNEINHLIDHWNANFDQGVSFLDLCTDMSGAHWGEHRQMEQLLLLGLAIDRLTYCFPKSIWFALPFNMPYIRNKKIDTPPVHMMEPDSPVAEPEMG